MTLFAQDFIRVDREAATAGAILADRARRVLERCAHSVLGPHATIDVGDARERDDVVVVPVRLECTDASCPFRLLDGDIQIAPYDDTTAHVSIAVTFEPRDDDLRLRSNAAVEHRRTEQLLRSFLAAVASMVERPRDHATA